MRTCRAVNLGILDYLRAWELQKSLVEEVASGTAPNTLLLLEHPSTYTIGRRGRREDVLLGDDELDSLGVSVHHVDRGGEATYHGPGQLVAYPVVDIRPLGGPLKFVRALEQMMIRTLDDFGIAAQTRAGLTGVWVSGEKIGSIGLKVSRGIASHGLSMNVNLDLMYFRSMIPCGNADTSVTSMERVLGQSVDMGSVGYSLQYHFGRLLKLKMVEVESCRLQVGTPAGLHVSTKG